MNILQELRDWLKGMFRLGEDMVPEEETISAIEDGVEFKGAKLWILVLAIFVASLGLNTNSAAVIIGAMLISPLMGPIIGMGLGVGINNFMLFKRAAMNYLVATLFSVATAALYFLITPIDDAQSELLARTSPTIYDVGIALCGGLAGIVALSSRSQRMGNVIPGVAIATALMPPLCTVGFGVATGSWLFALGALYLYLINTIFISLATFIGVRFVVRYPKKVFVDKAREKRVTHIITLISILTIIPSVYITFQMVQETIFAERCQDFCREVVQTDKARIISSEYDYDHKTIRVVLLGEEVDSAEIAHMVSLRQQYGLSDVHLDIVQGAGGLDAESVQGILSVEKNKLLATQKQLSNQDAEIKLLRDSIEHLYVENGLSRILLPEVVALFPEVKSLSAGKVLHSYMSDSMMLDSSVYLVSISTDIRMRQNEEQRLNLWLQQRLGRKDIKMVVLSIRR
jgi:uncharacterized hydrophobic protein (TIGR00271 family)